MAGNFGYEAGHYDISMKMAEAALLPKVRSAGADTIVVPTAPVAAIRSPMALARESVHVARVLARALA